MMTDLLRDLIRIPSPSRDETAAADLLQARMVGLGLDAHRVGNNLWCESEPASEGRPTILLNAHIDTVKPASGYTRDPYEPSVEDGRIYGLGSNDDGGSLVSLLQTYLELCRKPQPYRLVYSATAEEEVTGTGGIDLIFPEVGRIDFGVIGEPTGMRIAAAEKGLLVFDCTAHGVSGHAARNEGVNALYRALDDIAWIRDYHFEKESPYLGPIKMTATMISCGTQHNVVPDKCTFVVDVRPNGEYTNAEIVDIVRSHLSSEAVPRSLRNNSSSISAGHPAMVRAAALGFENFGSPTTSNQTRCVFPTIKLGPGESGRSHSADEYILIDEIEAAVPRYVALLDGLQL